MGADERVHAARYVLDRESVRAVDRAALAEYGIPGLILMENASRALAAEVLDLLRTAPPMTAPTVLIVCGSGNNGGDGWALARHLHNGGVRSIVAVVGEPKPDTDAGVNCAICRRMGIAEITLDEMLAGRGPVAEAGLIVDALLGTGLDRPVRGRAVEAIDWINASGRPVLAVDVPSGLDCDTGAPLGAAVRATRTVSFVGAKPGYLEAAAAPYVGEVVVGDIGAPRELTERFGRPCPPDAGPAGGGRT